jgi:hypothetical protein
MRVVVFAPHAGIWVHAFPEALVIDALRANGHEVVYVTCGGALSSLCVTMSARGLKADSSDAEKAAVCRDCQHDRDLLRRGFGFPGYDIDSVLDEKDRTRITEQVSRLSPATVADFEVDGVRVGRATLYEFMLHRKKSVVAVTEEEWPLFRPRLENTLLSLAAATAVLDREKPDRVFTYNSLYSVNAVWRAAAEKRGIPSYFQHAGVGLEDRLQTMIIGRDSTLAQARALIEAWPRYRELPVGPDELSKITGHLEQLFLGKSMFAYSAAKSSKANDVRARFGVRADQKLLVASMSSYDEYIAAVAIGEMPAQERSLFPSQIEWIRALVEWMRTRPDLFLLVRVHPREFPNKREGTKSEHASQLEAALTELPPNVRVNWPADELSIYDLAEQANVFLNAWSSVGREMALLGLPVVVYGPELLLYPADLNCVGTTRPSYFSAIDEALRSGWSFERARQAFRWCVLELRRSIVEIDDGFSFSEQAPRTLIAKAWHAMLARTGLRKRWDLFARPPRLRNQRRIVQTIEAAAPTLLPEHAYSDVDRDTETAALRVSLARLARAFAPGPLRDNLDRLSRA